MKGTISKNALRAVSHFAAKKDIRYYLVSVCVEFTPEDVRLVATNGHVLGAMRVDYHDGDTRPAAPFQAIIPLAAVKALKRPGRKDSATVSLSVDGDSYSLQDGDTLQNGKLLDAKYPDWRRVVPTTLDGKPGQFNAEYLMLFHAAACELGTRLPRVSIAHNGDNSALVDIGVDAAEFVGVIMPLRRNAVSVLETAPEWVHGKLKVAA